MTTMILGATGQVGTQLRTLLGQSAIPISRAVLDLRSDPLPLENVEVIIDVTDNKRRPSDLPIIARNVVDSIQRSPHTPRVICLHVHNQHQSDFSYYRQKQQQHEVYATAGINYTPIYATQFSTLLTTLFDAAKPLGLILSPRGARWQPVDTRDVAKLIATLPEKSLTIAGPETLTSAEAARRYSTRRLLLPLPIPGAFGSFLRAGLNLATAPDVVGERRFMEGTSS